MMKTHWVQARGGRDLGVAQGGLMDVPSCETARRPERVRVCIVKEKSWVAADVPGLAS
jgi:hypothetical protein